MARFKAPAPAPPTPARRREVKKDLSLVIKFDDLVRNEGVLLNGAEPEFLKFVRNAIEWRKKWHYAEMERQRLNVIVTEKENELAGKDHQIKQARKFVEQEQKARQKAEAERETLQKQLQSVRDLLLADGGRTINNETLERIKKIDLSGFAGNAGGGGGGYGSRLGPHMNPVMEESVESILDASDLSFEESRDDILGESRIRGSAYPTTQQRRSSTHKRRSHSLATYGPGGEKLVTKTTVVVGKDGSAHAESFIETLPVNMDLEEARRQRKRSRQSRDLLNDDKEMMFAPSAPPMMDIMVPTTPSHPVKRTFSNAGSVPSRPHCFQKKTVVVVENCGPCGKRIRFGKSVLKCRDCMAVCHMECKHEVPVPCVANVARTPNAKSLGNYLADYTPLEPPMIPPLLDYCVKEVEMRGLSEVGIYRVPGNETESNELLEKFLHGRGQTPRLNKLEIHTITSCIKKFLRHLKEPVIPLSLWHDFVNAANNPDSTMAETDLYQAISELPQPNRDTLAYLVVHLQAVAANSAVNKMDMDNLAMVMGPTIVGNSSSDPMAIMSESGKLKGVMRALLSISADYWSTFLSNEQDHIFSYVNNGPSSQQQMSTNRYFKPMTVASPVETYVLPPPTTGGPARRTRSKQHSTKYGNGGSRKQALFQSPMLH